MDKTDTPIENDADFTQTIVLIAAMIAAHRGSGKPGRERSLLITKLQEARFWAEEGRQRELVAYTGEQITGPTNDPNDVAEDPVEDISPFNKFAIATRGFKDDLEVLFLVPVPDVLTPADALLVAAYIVTLVCEPEKWESTLGAVVREIESPTEGNGDATNKLSVSAGRNANGQTCEITFPAPLPRELNANDALLLAAYLVALVKQSATWEATLTAVQNA